MGMSVQGCWGAGLPRAYACVSHESGPVGQGGSSAFTREGLTLTHHPWKQESTASNPACPAGEGEIKQWASGVQMPQRYTKSCRRRGG